MDTAVPSGCLRFCQLVLIFVTEHPGTAVFFCRTPLPHIHSNKLTLPSSLTHLSEMPKYRLTFVTFSLQIYRESVIRPHADKPGITVIFFFFLFVIITPTELPLSF